MVTISCAGPRSLNLRSRSHLYRQLSAEGLDILPVGILFVRYRQDSAVKLKSKASDFARVDTRQDIFEYLCYISPTRS